MKRPTVILSLGLFILIVVILLSTRPGLESRKVSQAEFLAMFQSNLLSKVRVYYPAKLEKVDGVQVMLNEVRGTYYQTDGAAEKLRTEGMPSESAFIARVHLTPELEGKLLTRTNVSVIELNPFVRQTKEWISHSK